MTVNLSLLGGAGWQFSDNNGSPLSGGLLYTYQAGTTTPQATYTSNTGVTAQTNPIVLDSAGRIAGGEIWLTQGQDYKFVLKTSAGASIGTYDNVPGANDISQFIAPTGSSLIGYLPAGSGAVATTVQTKLRESVSVKDFGAVGNGIADDTTSIKNAADYCVSAKKSLYFPSGTYLITPNQINVQGIETFGDGANSILKSTGIVGPILKAEGNPALVYDGFGNDTYIHGLQLDGTTNAIATIGLSLIAQINCRVENIYVRRLNIAFNESALIRSSYNNIRDVSISFSNAERCNYIVYNNSGYRTADIDFTNSQLMANIYHFYLNGTVSNAIDGYNIIGNTLFADPDDPSYAHENCVYVKFGGYWSNIAHNKFFEAGGNAVALFDSAHTNVSDNQFAYYGRRGVNIANGGCAAVYVNSSSSAFNKTTSVETNISDNIMIAGTAEAVWVANSASIQISNNLVSQTQDTYAAFTYPAISLTDCAEPKVFSNTVSAYNTTSNVQTYQLFDVMLSGCRNEQIDHFPAFRVSGDSNQIEKDFYAGGIVSRSFAALMADGNTFANWDKSAFNGTVSAPVVTANAATAPDGTATAAQIVFGATTSVTDQLDSYIQYPITTTVTTADDYVFSVYLRSASPTVIAMTILSADATRSIVVVPIDTVWRRVWIRHTGNTAAATLICRLWNTPNSGAKTIFAWGANCNALGELFPMILTQTHGSAQPTIAVRNNVNFGSRIGYANATPVSAYSSVGDRLINTPPVVGQPKGWVCTVSGSPGTWVSEGNL